MVEWDSDKNWFKDFEEDLDEINEEVKQEIDTIGSSSFVDDGEGLLPSLQTYVRYYFLGSNVKSFFVT